MRPSKSLCLAFAAMFVASALPSQLAAQQTQYKLIDLGTLGGSNSQTNGGPPPMINNRGVIAGMADTPLSCGYLGGSVSAAFRWDNGVMTDLGLLRGGCFSLPNSINSGGMIVGSGDIGLLDPVWGPVIRADFRYKGQVIDLGTFGGNNSLANQVNERGQVDGGAETTDADPWNFGGLIGLPSPTAWHAALWQEETMLDLGTLGGPDSFAFTLNEEGQISGFSFTNSTPNATTGLPTLDPFLWKGGSMTDLGTLGGVFGFANGLNNRGQVVGFSDLAGDNVNHAFIWQNGEISDIGTLGGDNSTAGWINDAGQVVGVSDLVDGTHHAFIWQNGKLTDLGTVGKDPCSNTEYINERGQVIGTSTNCHGAILHIFLWENGSMIDLSSQVLPGSDFVSLEPVVISETGEIVANGVLDNGDVHAVLLVPCSDGCELRVASSSNQASATSQAVGNSHTALLERTPSSRLERVRAQMRYRYDVPRFKQAKW